MKIFDFYQMQTLRIVSKDELPDLFLITTVLINLGNKCQIVIKLHLPSTVSTQSCSPKFCCGFITQWLLVAVMSNTSQPPSDAWTFLESSKNVSASLKVRKKEKNICIKQSAFKIVLASTYSFQDYYSCVTERVTFAQTDGEMNVVTLLLHCKQITKPQCYSVLSFRPNKNCLCTLMLHSFNGRPKPYASLRAFRLNPRGLNQLDWNR